jgi:hypothetical protein
MSDTPEILSNEAANEATADIQTIQEARDKMDTLAQDIPELAEINSFTQRSHEPGATGINALDQAISKLAKLEPGIARRAGGNVAAELNGIYNYLVRERASRDLEATVAQHDNPTAVDDEASLENASRSQPTTVHDERIAEAQRRVEAAASQSDTAA